MVELGLIHICHCRGGSIIFWLGGQVHSLCIVYNMKRRGVWGSSGVVFGARRMIQSNFGTVFLKELVKIMFLLKITKWYKRHGAQSIDI